ncbi:MAG: rRNA maturation RNase YbeY, partial [Candidatus Eisenbacteria bacterium]
EWRCIDRATDVLSFSYDETGPGETVRPAGRVPSRRPGPGGAGISAGSRAPNRRRARPRTHGDLVISLDRARDQARRFRVSEGAELARLVIHGALHLAGLDHRRPVERRRMRARENAVLKSQRTSVQALERALRRDAASAAKHAGAARRRG